MHSAAGKPAPPPHRLGAGRLDPHRLIRNIDVAIALGSVVAGIGRVAQLLVARPR